MNTVNKNKISRQMERAAIRRGLENRLRSMDFQGERVAVRNHKGDAVIHRPERQRFKDLVNDTFKRHWIKRVEERRKEREVTA